MKRLFKNIICAVLAPVALVSCMDLDENVYDKLPTDEFGTTEKQINAIMAPAYQSLKNMLAYDGPWGAADMTADILMAPTRVGGDWWDGGQYMEQCMHSWKPNSYSVENCWDYCTGGLTTVNSVYNIIEKSEAMSDELKLQYLSELRGLRAFWYYVIVDIFGNAPLVTDFEDTSLPSSTSRADIYKYVVKELTEIIPNLRSDVSDASYGKFTQGAARMVLAKMYLNAEEWIGEPNWKGVVEQCDEIMKLEYIIEPNWKTNFEVHNEVSREIILPICYKASDSWGNSIHLWTLHYLDPDVLGFTGGMWNGINAQPDFVRTFDTEDPRYEGSFLIGPMIDPNTGEVLKTTLGHDLIHTIDLNVVAGTEKTDADGNLTPWGEVHQEDGARINKLVYEKGMQNTNMENDIAIFRLADVYLMKAEALVRMGGDLGEATRLVNAIRERAYGNSDHNYTSVTLDDIYNERGYELAFEFVRRQDMIRFGTYLKPRYMKPKQTPEYRKIFPIPFKAWQKNNNLVQNPGYPAF